MPLLSVSVSCDEGCGDQRERHDVFFDGTGALARRSERTGPDGPLILSEGLEKRLLARIGRTRGFEFVHVCTARRIEGLRKWRRGLRGSNLHQQRNREECVLAEHRMVTYELQRQCRAYALLRCALQSQDLIPRSLQVREQSFELRAVSDIARRAKVFL